MKMTCKDKNAASNQQLLDGKIKRTNSVNFIIIKGLKCQKIKIKAKFEIP